MKRLIMAVTLWGQEYRYEIVRIVPNTGREILLAGSTNLVDANKSYRSRAKGIADDPKLSISEKLEQLDNLCIYDAHTGEEDCTNTESKEYVIQLKYELQSQRRSKSRRTANGQQVQRIIRR